jgi:ABC-type glutathione transport system ATPase component
MRVAVLGNSGSGKSTLARWIAGYTYAPLLDLDRSVGTGKDCRSQVTGCYASLVNTALEYSPLLIFLNPGEGQCISNCRARPWEAHKYASRAEQDQQLAFLLSWVSEYYMRDGDMSLTGHQACFNAYTGRKVEVTVRPRLDPPSAEVLAWLN